MPAPWTALADELAAADVVVSTTGADRPIVSLEDYRAATSPAGGTSGRCSFWTWPCRGTSTRRFARSWACTSTESTIWRKPASATAPSGAKSCPPPSRSSTKKRRRFVAEVRHQATGPVIARFREGLEKSQSAELERLFARLPDLDERSRREIEQFADRLVGKMLHPPLASLRDESAKRPAARPVGSAAAAVPAQRLSEE